VFEFPAPPLILRTSWLYAARGDNFAKKIRRLAAERERLTVIDDQVGAPTGADLVADVSADVIRASFAAPEASGTYHVAATGEVSWCGYARFVLQLAQQAGVALRAGPESVEPLATSAYLTPAQRPLNSRLDTTKLRHAFGLHLPHWKVGVARMLTEVLTKWSQP
jgi:dTDP-4-dehydrorhamnose reductase